MNQTKSILCVGDDNLLLECRCAVLERSGYQACPATFPDAFNQLLSGRYDLVIISARHASQQNGAFSERLPSNTQTLVLNGVTFPDDLLTAVSKKLQNN